MLLINIPEVAALYQLIDSPAPGVAPMVIAPAPHLEAPTATGALTAVITCANTAVLSEKQPDVDLEAT